MTLPLFKNCFYGLGLPIEKQFFLLSRANYEQGIIGLQSLLNWYIFDALFQI